HIVFADKIFFSSPMHEAQKGGILKVSFYLIFPLSSFLMIAKPVTANTDEYDLNRMLYMFPHFIIKNVKLAAS
ncbi:hypothetical protein ACQP3L_36140, partial [Escherichia coli]